MNKVYLHKAYKYLHFKLHYVRYQKYTNDVKYKTLVNHCPVKSSNRQTLTVPTLIYFKDPKDNQTNNVNISEAVAIHNNNNNNNTVNEWHPKQTISDASISELVHYYKKLSKFRLTSLVVITTMSGYAMSPGVFDLNTFALCSLGTGLVSAAANSINQYHEIPFDSQMSRTKSRVLVVGKVTPLHAVTFALLSASTGLSLIYFGVNGLAASLCAANLFLYTSVYTPMKRISILNTWIGSIVGAVPPLIGWSACSGGLDIGALILAGMLYAWQFPHFNALSWNLRAEYSRAGYCMMAVSNPDLCRRTAFRYTFVIGILSGLSYLSEITNIWFVLLATPLNGYFSYLAYKFYKNGNSQSSRRLFKFSLLHLPLLMTMFILCKKKWTFPDSYRGTTTEEILNGHVHDGGCPIPHQTTL